MKSGNLRKGDFIWYGPKVYKYNSNNTVRSAVSINAADNHWAVYWGNGRESRQWHSSSPYNRITAMMGMTSKVYVFVFHTKPLPGTLSITEKLNDSSALTSGGYSLKGVKYRVYKSNKTTKVTELTTDAKGKCSVKLDAGTYYFKKISTGTTNIKPDTAWHKVTINESKTTSCTVTDSVIYAGLKIQNTIVTGDTNEAAEGYPLEGYKFTITNTKNGRQYTAVTNAKGQADFGNVPAGTYKMEEVLSSKQQDTGITSVTQTCNVTLVAGKAQMMTWKNKVPSEYESMI